MEDFFGIGNDQPGTGFLSEENLQRINEFLKLEIPVIAETMEEDPAERNTKQEEDLARQKSVPRLEKVVIKAFERTGEFLRKLDPRIMFFTYRSEKLELEARRRIDVYINGDKEYPLDLTNTGEEGLLHEVTFIRPCTDGEIYHAFMQSVYEKLAANIVKLSRKASEHIYVLVGFHDRLVDDIVYATFTCKFFRVRTLAELGLKLI